MGRMQRALSLIFPDQCVLCEERVEHRGGLCAECWREMPFLTGLVCDACGVSLPGADTGHVLCDECLTMHRPWDAGRAALSYSGAGRRVVLALKHADRLDLVPPCAEWMIRAGKHLWVDPPVLVPVPAHWTRLLTRRYNQAAELCRAVAKLSGCETLPDALLRTKRTPKQDGMTVDERFANMRDAIAVHPKTGTRLAGREVCLIDDVMTSGATLSAATDTLLDMGAARVCTLVLARVEKAP